MKPTHPTHPTHPTCLALAILVLLCVTLPIGALHAQPTSSAPVAAAAQTDLAKLDQRLIAAQSSADNAWMLVSAALVLMMTGPGLALFYGGLVRQKNTLAIMIQSFALMAFITVLWAVVGYSLCFGEGTPIIGGFGHVLLRGVGVDPNADYAATIPQLTFMVYQLMFAIITPALITGATAERMTFSGTVVFMALWSLCVYAPLAHMVWGKGGLLNATLGGRFPTLDFAGGTVVHISSGVSALVCALYLGKRTGYPKEPMPPHSLVLSSPRTVSRRARSSRRISRRRRRPSAGSPPNGRRAAGRARSAQSPAPSQVSWRLRRRQGSSRRCRQ